MWKDAKLKKLDSESKLLFIYLLSCQHRNVLGLYNLPKCYVQGDLGYGFERVSKGFKELLDSGFVTYDEGSETVLVNNFLKYNPLENHNQVVGALKAMNTIPKTALFYNLADILNTSDNKYLTELKNGIDKYLKVNGLERVTLTVPKQEEEEEEEEVKEEEEEEEEIKIIVANKFDNESFEIKACNYLIENILENNPKAKVPISLSDKQKWAVHIDLMVRRDSRTEDEIRKVIKFATEDSFWSSNILSTKKLREKFDTLFVQSKDKKRGPKKNSFTDYPQAVHDYDNMEKKIIQMRLRGEK